MDRPIQFKDLPEDLESLVTAFHAQVDWATDLVEDFRGRQFNGEREEALIYCLENALEFSRASLLCIEHELPNSLTLLSRALLETLFWTRYVSISDENAKRYEQLALDELKRNARKNLRAGFAHVIDTSTKEDKTEEFLHDDLMKEIPHRPRIVEVAKAGGLARVYTNVYGFISIYAHGAAYGLSEDTDTSRELFVSASSSLGCQQCINLVVSDWIKWRKSTPAETISRLLGVPIDAA